MNYRFGLFASAALLVSPASAQQATRGATGELFHAPLDNGVAAERAAGEPRPLFVEHVEPVPDGAVRGAVRAADNQLLAGG